MTTEIQELVITIKRELLQLIILGMRHVTMSPDKAQSLAKEFLEKAVGETKEDILNALYHITIDYADTRELYIKYATPYYDNKKICMLNTIRECVANGDIDNAVSTAYGRCRS